jgi:type I restriction enzyme M protein
MTDKTTTGATPVRRPPRRTLFDGLHGGRNKYCRREDLGNEASVETFFIARMLKDLGFKDSQIKPKASLRTLVVSLGGRKTEKYRPDFALVIHQAPRCIVDAKATDENPEAWIPQCSGYCLTLNQKYSSTNPVRYFILSNGLRTLLYHWDDANPVLELTFADFEWGNPKYERLKSLLGPKSITSASQTQPPGVPQFALTRPTSERARQLFAQCHKAIWKAEVCNPSAAFMAFVKVVFVKLWADKRLRHEPATRDFFKPGTDTAPLPATAVVFSERWIMEREAEGAVNPIDTILFERLREEIEREIQERKKKRIFNKGERIGLKPDTVKEIVRRLQHFDMFGIDEDLNGRLFETFLSATMRGRELGQFFTPRSVVKMMTRIADLKATRSHQDRVIDACCGSGGFLIEALTLMRNTIRANASMSETEKVDLIDTVSNVCLYGIDAGKEPPLARIARINMYLHGDGGSRIYYADGLDKALRTSLQSDPEDTQNVNELRHALQGTLQFDVALTNPPFSMSKESRNQTEKQILSAYVLAKRDAGGREELCSSLRSSVMFIERYHDILRPGGHLITVLDDTLLASADFTRIRDFIRESFLIRAIISLPGDTFRRAGSRVKTSVLVLQKKASPDEQQPNCFAFFSEALGVDDLTPRASEADIRAARARAEAETEDILKGYLAYLAGKHADLILKPERLADRLDLKFCAPHFGRMARKWRAQGIAVKPMGECVSPVEAAVIPADHPDEQFILIKVTYDGQCELSAVRKGAAIKADKMFRVRRGQMVFSQIRATDGAIAIVPPEMDGALVSGSYYVFDCGDEEETAYLWAVLRSHELRADMQSQSPGSGRYVTYWPDIQKLLVPLLPETERRTIGRSLLDSWQKEREVQNQRSQALARLARLEVESEESVKRWRASKAPT